MKRRETLRYSLIFFVVMILIASGFISGLCFFLLYSLNFIPLTILKPVFLPVAILFSCVVIGTLLSFIVSQRFLRPVMELIKATKEVSKGNFKIRVAEEDSQGEFDELLRSFNHMTEELGSIEMFRNDFINNFSHEFKTPIVSIRGFAKQLKNENLSPEQKKEYIDIIIYESNRLTHMSSNVLLLSKFENQQIITDKTEFYLDEQLRKCVLLFEKQWSMKNIDLKLELDEVKYYSNEEMLSQVWINLISNAIKFSEEKGEITIKCVRTTSGIVVEISDHGVGMSPVTVQRIFDKFYQGDSSHKAEGTGLGLSLAKRVVELCRGTITVNSTMGIGTTFIVQLPVE